MGVSKIRGYLKRDPKGSLKGSMRVPLRDL